VTTTARLSLQGFYNLATGTTRNSWWLRYYYQGAWHEVDCFTADFGAAFSDANRHLAMHTQGIEWVIAHDPH
jgi:hypothetical protein